MNDQRNKPRGKTSDYFLIYNSATDELVGRVLNMTVEGAMLISEEPVDPNIVIPCRLRLPEPINGCQELIFDMESRWSCENRQLSWYETGYKLLNMSELTEKVLGLAVRRWMKIKPEPSSSQRITL